MPPFEPDSLRYDDRGLIPAVAQDAASGEILMLAYMNREAVVATLATGDVTYWSRSRNALWRKGATSGHTQRLVEMRIDCDRDALVLLIEQVGPACHTNRRSCFYVTVSEAGEVERLAPEA